MKIFRYVFGEKATLIITGLLRLREFKFVRF